MVRKCSAEDLNQMVEMAYRKNNEEAHYSAFCYTGREKIEEEFTGGIDSEDNILIGYFEESNLKGLLCGYIDYERRSVDCSGPFVDGDFNQIASDMFDFMKASLQPPMRYTYYFGKKNTECLKFMEYTKAVDQGNEYILRLKRNNFIRLETKVQVETLPNDQHDQLVMVHDTIFPDVYISGKGIIRSLGNDRQVFCVLEDTKMIAHGVLKTYKDSNLATAEIIGVAENYRRLGYGRAVLSKLAEVAFEDVSIDIIELVVDKINEKALSLYLSMGFEVYKENCNYLVNLI